MCVCARQWTIPSYSSVLFVLVIISLTLLNVNKNERKEREVRVDATKRELNAKSKYAAKNSVYYILSNTAPRWSHRISMVAGSSGSIEIMIKWWRLTAKDHDTQHDYRAIFYENFVSLAKMSALHTQYGIEICGKKENRWTGRDREWETKVDWSNR